MTANAPKAVLGGFVPSPFFVLRTALLPWDAVAALGASETRARAGDGALDVARTRITERLRELAADPAVREALFVASPSLDEAVEAWLTDPRAMRAGGVVDILVRYVSRMAGRPTPFGLFAGCTTGAVESETRFELAPRQEYRRHTRLDMQYLAALTEALHGDPALRGALCYRPSSSVYEAAREIRYAEGRTDAATRARTYHLVSVERTKYLDAALTCAGAGSRPSAIVDAVVASDDGIERADAEAFVESLIDSQILVSDLAPPITGNEPLEALAPVLTEAGEPGARAAEILANAGRALGALDAAGLGNAPARYRDVATALRALPAEPELARLFQVDLHKPARLATLGGEVLREIERAVALLARIAPRSESKPLKRFQEAFSERYGERTEGPLRERQMVPLTVALDEEAGIGFGVSADPSPLIDGLDFPPDPSPPEVAFGPREARLLRGLCETLRAGATEWALSERDVEALDLKNATPLPDAFAVMTAISARSEDALARGEFRVIMPSVSGPSGALLLGRFCHGDPALRRGVEAHLAAEEALRPDVVFAEIVHLPEGRTGNILCRPVLRRYEIPFLGRSGAPTEQQLPLSDLYVTLSSGSVVLWSRRLDREVLPRLTSAHNFARESLGVYQFLCSLQHARERASLGWDWGPLATSPFLPRVTHGRIVLSLARWNLAKDELEPLKKARGDDVFRTVQALRARRGLPRWVGLVDFDNVLPVDLDNVLSVESWARLVKSRDAATLREMIAENELVVRGPEGSFVHEIVVPFVREPRVSVSEKVEISSEGAASRAHTLARSFPPGSEWLYARLYTGTACADAVLTEVVRPLVDDAREMNAFNGWFFLRYGDPHWHVRLRFRGDPQRLAGDVLPLLTKRAAPLLANGRVWRIELGTYERETERYGGDAGIELAEELFCADSDAVLSIVEQLDAEDAADDRWRLALRGCHLLLMDLGLGLAARIEILRRARSAFGAEHRVDKPFESKLGMRFRPERTALEALLAARVGEGHPLDVGFEALAARSERARPVSEALLARERDSRLTIPVRELALSFLHMHCNRLLRAGQRAQELVIYDWLLRLYESEAARSRRPAKDHRLKG